MKLQGGAIAVAHAGFLGTTYSYTSSEGVNVMVCSLFFSTLPDKTKELVNLHNLEKTCTHKIKHTVQNFWLSTSFTGKFRTFFV